MNRLFDEAFWDPFSSFFDRSFFDRSFFPVQMSSGKFFPQTDISEDEKNLQIEVNIPGYDPKDVRVDVEEGRLVIQGQTEQKQEDRQKNYFRRERSVGKFYREIPLPQDVDPQKAECVAKNGMLRITLPKTDVKHRKSLPIKEE